MCVSITEHTGFFHLQATVSMLCEHGWLISSERSHLNNLEMCSKVGFLVQSLSSLRLFHWLSCWLSHFTFVPEMQSFTSSWPWPPEFCFVSSWESVLWSFTLALFVHLHTPFREVYLSPPPILYHIIYSWTKKATSLLNCLCAVRFLSSVLVILTWIFALLWTILSNQRDLVYYHKHLWQSYPWPSHGSTLNFCIGTLSFMMWFWTFWFLILQFIFVKNLISYRFFKSVSSMKLEEETESFL